MRETKKENCMNSSCTCKWIDKMQHSLLWKGIKRFSGKTHGMLQIRMADADYDNVVKKSAWRFTLRVTNEYAKRDHAKLVFQLFTALSDFHNLCQNMSCVFPFISCVVVVIIIIVVRSYVVLLQWCCCLFSSSVHLAREHTSLI